MNTERKAGLIVYGNAAIILILAGYFFLIPGFIVIRNISDPALKEGRIPAEAWRLHKYLTPRYAKYAKERIASKAAKDVDMYNVPATEWPLFGSVFYLWATENLQKAWENGEREYSSESPAKYARETIEACKDLLLDPIHHTWVKKHWGDKYMHRENVFFRSLLIAGLTSYEKLTKSGKYIPLLKDQCDTLAADLDKSPYGVLYDYPGECYPIDVFAAVAWIKEADKVTGADHSAFFANELRAFSGNRLDRHGLIPWLVDPKSGEMIRPNSRGIINSHVLTFAPDLYPEAARKWYKTFEENFWQKRWYGEGWREFYKDIPNSEWTFDIDSGPIIGGFSPAANAFGFAAAERNGRLDHAYILASQVLTAAWPLPDGRLLGCRALSDSNAPYLGECGVLWQLTVTPPENARITKGGHWGGGTYIGLCIAFGTFLLALAGVILKIREFSRKTVCGAFQPAWDIDIQLRLWIALLILSAVFAFFNIMFSLIFLLIANFMPRTTTPLSEVNGSHR